MQCNVPGCQHEATEKVLVEGIYHGIFISLPFQHCSHHTSDELRRTETRLTEKHAKGHMMCDPLTDSRNAIRKKPYGLGKAS